MPMVVIFNTIFTFQKWYITRVKRVLAPLAFVLLQPQECLSSHAADGQGQTHICALMHITVRAVQMTTLSMSDTIPSCLSNVCDAVTSSPRSAATIYHQQKGNSWNSWQVLPAQHTAFHLMCHRVSVCLPSTRRAKDFKISQRQMAERGKSCGK